MTWKRILFSLLWMFVLYTVMGQPTVTNKQGYDIKVTIKPYARQKIYLGYHFGKLKYLADSVVLNDQFTGHFTGTKPLPGGIYFIVSPQKQILFEVLVDKPQQFSISADSTNGFQPVTYVGSPDNLQFQEYSKFINEKGRALQAAQLTQKQASTATEQNQAAATIKKLNEEIDSYRKQVIRTSGQTMLGTLFTVMQEPEVPSAAQHPGGKYDSLYAYQYYKQHYWDGVQFSDARLVRTPVFEQKLDKYYKELVVPVPDSIIKEVDKMMSQAVREPEMYKYLLNYFVQQYINPQYMGLDAVFVHLFEKYINNNPAVDWYDEKQQKYIQDRAYSLMANLVGLPAQNLVMVDTAGKKTELYSINAPFTVLCFWDPTCGHCKEMVPKLDSIYQKKWKAKGIKIVGVMVDGGKENWTKYIREQKLDWIHIYQTQADRDAEYAASKPNYRQLYDVYQTPVLYLLDKEKRIIAKKLDQNQIDDLITLKTKTP